MTKRTIRAVGDRADEQLLQRKIRDRSLVFLMIGCILLMPPAAGVMELPFVVGGVPIILIYVFVVWALLIALAFMLSRSLHEIEQSHADRGLPEGNQGT